MKLSLSYEYDYEEISSRRVTARYAVNESPYFVDCYEAKYKERESGWYRGFYSSLVCLRMQGIFVL